MLGALCGCGSHVQKGHRRESRVEPRCAFLQLTKDFQTTYCIKFCVHRKYKKRDIFINAHALAVRHCPLNSPKPVCNRDTTGGYAILPNATCRHGRAGSPRGPHPSRTPPSLGLISRKTASLPSVGLARTQHGINDVVYGRSLSACVVG